jgi:DNA-binding PadR family transcriptional regulator
LTQIIHLFEHHNRVSKTKVDEIAPEPDRDLYSGLIRLHVLHHAARQPIFGLGMAEELARHGYPISPGTLYPLLHGLEKKGYLRSAQRRNGKSLRTVYRATARGREALEAAAGKVRELLRELVEGE